MTIKETINRNAKSLGLAGLLAGIAAVGSGCATSVPVGNRQVQFYTPDSVGMAILDGMFTKPAEYENKGNYNTIINPLEQAAKDVARTQKEYLVIRSQYQGFNTEESSRNIAISEAKYKAALHKYNKMREELK